MTASKLRLNVWALLVFFFLVGLGFLSGGVRLMFLARQSTTWPCVTGHVVSIEETTSRSIKGGSVTGVAVVYDYIFDGQSNQGHRIAFGFYGNKVRQQLSQMRKGDSLKISVNPRDASESVMFPGVTGATTIPAFIGLGVIGFTALVAFFVNRGPPWKVD